MRPVPHSLRALAIAGATLLALAGVAQAATSDSPASRSTGTDQAASKTKAGGRQFWQVGDYTTVELVARERGAADNQHPWEVDRETLKRELDSVLVNRGKERKTLFAPGEAATVADALVEAFAHARPDQDVALVSAARHDDNTFLATTAITARLFVVDGHLNLIVRDARTDFYDKARGTGVAPHFTVGSRTTPGADVLASANGSNVRADWLALSPDPIVSGTAAPVATPSAAPSLTAPPVVAVPNAPAPAPVPMAAPAPVNVKPVAPPAATAGNDPEKRLELLKRLYEKGLITSDEYQQKRKEILQGL